MLVRRSLEKHVVARIRVSVDKYQKELAAHVGVSTVTIKRVEALTLPLSASLAQKIGEYFRVSPAYLLENNLRRPPVMSDGSPWSKESFFRQRPVVLEDRFVDLLITSTLFHNYRRCRGGLHRVKEPLAAAYRLEELVDRAYARFLKEYPEAAKAKHATLRDVIADANAHIHSKLSDELIESLLESDLRGHRL